jgi:amino acid permease
MAHYNAPRFLNEMKDRKSETFKKATIMGYILSFIPNFVVMLFGFFAMNSYGFDEEKGEKKSGNIIKIFVDLVGKNDPALLLCTILYFINVLISYPFLFFSVRDTIMALIYPKQNFNQKQRLLVTELIFLGILGIGLTQPKIDVVVRLKGATACPCIAFLFPSILAMKLITKPTKQEKILNYLSLSLGILSMITGISFTLLGWLNIKITKP